jgi:hypothetical protein
MNVLQKEGFLMMERPDIGPASDAQARIIDAHRAELLAEAASQRLAHGTGSAAKAGGGLRRTLGLFLVRVGRGLAGEAAGSQPHSA